MPRNECKKRILHEFANSIAIEIGAGEARIASLLKGYAARSLSKDITFDPPSLHKLGSNFGATYSGLQSQKGYFIASPDGVLIAYSIVESKVADKTWCSTRW